MSNTWVVIADSSRVRVFTVTKPRGPLQELDTLTNPEARLHEQDLTTDFPGRTFDSEGEGRHAMGQNVSPKQQEILRFAKRTADYLEEARIEGRFSKLIVVAAPQFLGQLRQQFSPTTATTIIQEIPKNLTQQSTNEIRQQLPERI